jgi:uncharacterized protein (DUF1015 family)
VPRFQPFAGLRYVASDLSPVIAPPYDVIDDPERLALEASSEHNAVRLELPQAEDGRDPYMAAAHRLEVWSEPGGPLMVDNRPSFYLYRMTFTDEGGRPRQTSGVIGALGLEPPGEGDVLPHERTTPKAKSDRLDLIRATGTNLSPVWGLSLSTGLADLCQGHGSPIATAGASGGVHHELWRVTDAAEVAAIAERVGGAPVVIADGHHRYEVALAYQAEQRQAHEGRRGPWDAVMTFVVELSEGQLTVAAIHRLIAGLPDGYDLLGGLNDWFEPVGTAPVDVHLPSRMIEAGSLALVTAAGGEEATLLRPRSKTVEAADKDLDSSRLDVALAALPNHELTYQHGVANVAAAVGSGAAQAGLLLRPASVAQIESIAHARDRMPPKTTFFTPKPATGLVFRPASDSAGNSGH